MSTTACSICQALERTTDEIYVASAKELTNGNFQKAKSILQAIPAEERGQSGDILSLEAAIEFKLDNSNAAIKVLESGLEKGHFMLLPQLAWIHFSNNNLNWMQENKIRLLSGVDIQCENRDLLIETIYSWALETRNMKVLRELMAKVSDEELLENPVLANKILNKHRDFLKIVADTQKDNVTE